VFCVAMHITAAIYVNDNEEGLIEDIAAWLEKLAPRGRATSTTVRRRQRRRPSEVAAAAPRNHASRHRRALDLGTWQRIFYAEFDGQRAKRIIVKVLGLEG